MSILDEEVPSFVELNKCKKNFLESQIIWMRQEYQYLCDLIKIEKDGLENVEQSDQKSMIDQQNTQKIQQILQERTNKFKELKDIHKVRQVLKQELQEQISTDDFITLVLSYEQKIQFLQKEIKDRQSQLQIIELKKSTEETQEQEFQIKSVSSIDINYRILEKLKKQVLGLKLKRNRLQNNLQMIKSNVVEESTSTYSNPSTVKAIHSCSLNSENKQNKKEQVSVFQKILLLLKKRQHENCCLQNRISILMKKIDQKKGTTTKIKDQMANAQWRCIQNIEALNTYSDNNQNLDITMMQRNLNNCSFSFDISRFIKPNNKP